MSKLFAGLLSFFVPGGPVLGVLGYIFSPARMIVWVPLAFLVGSVVFAGIEVKDYVRSAEASKKLVVAQGDQIKDLTGKVELERQSVVTATKNIERYTVAVQTYAKQQQVYQAQISTIRNKLAPTKIIEKAQTNAQGASDDLNADYADMLRMFDQTTSAAAASTGSQGNPVQTTTTTTVTREDTTRQMASPEKRNPGP